MDDITQPTDHLPPASEREADDDRSTSHEPHPDVSATESGGVSPATAAEPQAPDRHSAGMMPPGAR